MYPSSLSTESKLRGKKKKGIPINSSSVDYCLVKEVQESRIGLMSDYKESLAKKF